MNTSQSILVMKFGGTSVANAGRIRNAARLITAEPGPVVVVTSALAGVTDELIRLGLLACSGAREDVAAAVGVLRTQHLAVARDVTSGRSSDPEADRAGDLEGTLTGLLDDLEHLLVGIELVQENSPRTADLLVSFGERLAAPILAAAIRRAGADAVAVDARSLIVIDDTRAPAAVDMDESRRRTREALLAKGNLISVVTGFIAATPDGRTATLGRGGSDYTASLMGAFLDARAIWIWTDVDGVMTTDPRVVPEARVLPAITYREAAEMAYFGSRVLHPSTMIPAVDGGIPIVIRNSLDPAQPGTRISHEPSPDALGVKAVSAIGDLALVTVEGSGMVGVPGVAERVFATTARLAISVYMVSQASSEHNISFVVGRSDGAAAVRGLEAEFELEIMRHQIDGIGVQSPVGIVAVIGEGMRGTPGVSQRMFTALGRAHVNVLAIAQGSSELNLSVAVAERELQRAVGAAHSRFGLTRDTHLFVVGKGLVGKALLRQVVDARRKMAEEHGIGLKVIGVCGRDELLFDLGGLSDERLTEIAGGRSLGDLGGEPRPADPALFHRIARSRWLDVVVIDVTAEDNADLHATALAHGFHVVTANKKPMAGPYGQYDRILTTAAEHGVRYHFETTFGAGLPALSTLQDLVATCDSVHRVRGCFSGTLGLICSELERGRPFSEAVRDARARGYTEPDPRDDLSGVDVARKGLIISRQLGARREMDDIDLAGLLTPELAAIADPDELIAALPALDGAMDERRAKAAATDRVLRYVADITDGQVTVGLQCVPRDSPLGQLSGPDNILVFETERYHEHPLVIRGPGAGAEVTAAGVLGDILKIVRVL